MLACPGSLWGVCDQRCDQRTVEGHNVSAPSKWTVEYPGVTFSTANGDQEWTTND
jgi:hypothetical protein